MPATYPLDLKDEIEAMHVGIGYLNSIGIPYEALDSLVGMPPGAVKAWLLRGPDGFHPLLMSGWSRPEFCFTLLLCSILGVWTAMDREARQKIAVEAAGSRQEAFWRGFHHDILSLGGMAPYHGESRLEEVTMVPSLLVRRGGLQPCRVAEILADYFPIYGVKTEQDLFDLSDRYVDFQSADRLKRNEP